MSKNFLQQLGEVGLVMSLCKAQCYDVSSMSGFQGKIEEVFPVCSGPVLINPLIFVGSMQFQFCHQCHSFCNIWENILIHYYVSDLAPMSWLRCCVIVPSVFSWCWNNFSSFVVYRAPSTPSQQAYCRDLSVTDPNWKVFFFHRLLLLIFR